MPSSIKPASFKQQRDSNIQLSIIIPCYNEQDVLPEFQRRLDQVLREMPISCEQLYINDGSNDFTASLLQQFSRAARVRHLNLSRNFGKEAAMAAGVDHARGQAIIFIDADLQDPPELLPAMVEKWQQGYEIVNMQRRDRGGDSWMKKITAGLYYRLIANANQRLDIPAEVSDFRLLGPRAVATLRKLPERARTVKSLASWLGFRSIELPYQREPRAAGHSKWNYLQLLDLAISSIISVSNRPLRWFSYTTLLLFAATLVQAGQQLYSAGFNQVDFATMAVACSTLGLALIGEYLAVVLEESRGRPLYVVDETQPPLPEASVCPLPQLQPAAQQTLRGL